MKSKIFLLLIIIYTAFTRLFLIDKIPQPLVASIITWRIISAGASLISLIAIFSLIKSYLSRSKIALLGSWVFAILPWVFEQGRISSQANLALMFLMSVFLIFRRIKAKWGYFLFLLVPLILFAVYPEFWFFRLSGYSLTLQSFIQNVAILTSADFLFFHNITFWWGGVRDVGVMFVSLLPFFIIGMYKAVETGYYKMILLLVGTLILAAMSPFFPESREFYLSIPVISLILSLGIYYWSIQSGIYYKIALIGVVLLLLYEMSQFFHFYFVHHSQEVISNLSKFHEPF